MSPKVHLACSITVVWGITFLLMFAVILAYNSFKLSGIAGFALFGVVIACNKLLDYFMNRWVPIRCPECQQRCKVSTKSTVRYHCTACDYHWHTGISTNGGSEGLG